MSQTFLDHNSDVVDELGHHKYFAKFKIADKVHVFCRETGSRDVVFTCSETYKILDLITIQEYREFLNNAYRTDRMGKTFRAVVSPFCRIWGKENLEPKRPLDSHVGSKAGDSLNLALHLYQKYESVRLLEQRYINELSKKGALQKAQDQKLVPKISAKEFKANVEKSLAVEKEIAEIKNDLRKYATNIREITSREVLEVKLSKDQLLELKTPLEARLHRVSESMNNNNYIKSKHFRVLKEYFPQIKDEKIVEVEKFHSEITKLLARELKISQRSISQNLEKIDTELASLDGKLSALLSNLENPGVIVDRVYGLANKKHGLEMENKYHKQALDFADNAKSCRTKFNEERKKQLSLIQIEINDSIKALTLEVYGRDRKSPYLAFSETNYVYEIFEDTGTGRAYSNLIIFDLAVFKTTPLPMIIHDSLMFKNVENEAVSNIFEVYGKTDRQVFVAIDEIQKYGEATASTIVKNTVLSLSDTKVLYSKDWRNKTDPK